VAHGVVGGAVIFGAAGFAGFAAAADVVFFAVAVPVASLRTEAVAALCVWHPLSAAASTAVAVAAAPHRAKEDRRTDKIQPPDAPLSGRR
jgi:hypothetical protein